MPCGRLETCTPCRGHRVTGHWSQPHRPPCPFDYRLLEGRITPLCVCAPALGFPFLPLVARHCRTFAPVYTSLPQPTTTASHCGHALIALHQVRGDLIKILRRLRKRDRDIDLVLIETTGLADPAPVVGGGLGAVEWGTGDVVRPAVIRSQGSGVGQPVVMYGAVRNHELGAGQPGVSGQGS